MQYAKFPMKFVNVSQIPDNNFSHKGSISAWDNIGKDGGIDEGFAPFDCRIVWVDPGKAKTGVLIQNTDYVLCSDGLTRAPRTIKVLFWHDNNINDLWVGRQLKQGEVFYQEGTAGNATGNHIHFNVGIGEYTGGYPLIKNQYGVWEIKGEIDPTKIFFIDDSNVVKNTKGMKWKRWEGDKSPLVTLDPIIKPGDKVKIIGTHYATGQVIKDWVKKGTYTVSTVRNNRALLAEIKSYVYIKDLKKE